MSEFDIYGIFVPGLLIFAVLGIALTVVLRRLLRAIGLYHFVWHAALFDAALFVLAVGVVFLLFKTGSGNALPLLGLL
jgi:protein AaeX